MSKDRSPNAPDTRAKPTSINRFDALKASFLTHSHTPAAGGPLRTLLRFVQWQFMARFCGHRHVFDFVSGLKLNAERGHTSATTQFYLGLYEWDIAGFILHAVGAGDKFVDIGANVGVYTVLAAGACKADVIACEPSSDSLLALKANVALNDLCARVSVRHVAVGDALGVIHLKRGLGAMNSVSSDPKQTETVDVVVLDSLSDECAIDFLKVDTVGFEQPVLKGGPKTLVSPRLKAIILGNARRSADFGFDPAETIRLVTAAGFTPVSYDPVRRTLAALPEVDYNLRTIFVRNIDEMAKRVAMAPPFKIRGNHY